MTSIGYGDITPKNMFEIQICILFAFISSAIFAFSINQIGSIIEGINKDQREKEDLITHVNKYLKNKGISFDLQFNIREYIEYYYRESLNNQQETEFRLMEIISDPLK